MVSRTLANDLRLAGVRWRPASGDTFVIAREGFESDVFVVSDMTIESHEFESGTILGFNGTTEWALDSVALEDALWLPQEHQLRALLGGTFKSLVRTENGYRVELSVGGEATIVEAEEADDAYAEALLTLVYAAL
ncbi:hypothetical protein [Lacisediminihabitans sp.]|jgi:hypothetical protein|uniref:hypothetical protein n=1 Tax=Lacisediminihabitans sp. TaxID=2787631 RepID=UPI002F943676